MDTLKTGDIIENYEIVKLLGSGSMGRVYLAKEKDSRTTFAIKESLDYSTEEEGKEGIDIFLREADFLKRINHPALPAYHKLLTYRDKKYLVMEHIEGVSLEKMIESAAGPFRDKLVAYWAIQLCEILFYLHTLTPEPVIYRDIKPSNMMVTNQNVIRVIDFGVARRYDPAKDSDTIRLGTPGYAAPEQCRRKGQSTPRSDIYSLGVVLHQLLTLHDPSVTPFKLPSIKDLNAGVPEQLVWMINKAINLDPAERYLDAGLFWEELKDFYEEHFGTYLSPYGKELPFMKKADPLLVPVKKKEESFFSGLLRKPAKIILPLAIGSVGFFIYLFFFRPDTYLCFMPFLICIVAAYFLFREFSE